MTNQMIINDKCQSPNDKINSKSKYQMPKQKMFCHLIFVLCVYFEFCALIFVIYSNAYALNLDKLKVNFLNGEYKTAILEGEKILADYQQVAVSDELYYILGLSYLKDGNYLRASDIFEIILKEFKNSNFKEESKLGLADSYFLKGDFANAERYYQKLINDNPYTKLKAQVYYRLSHLELKKGNTAQAKDYLAKLKEKFPQSLEVGLDKDLYSLSDVYYAIQVGSFLNSINAKNLMQKLMQKNYPAYIEETGAYGKTIYRVRVGKFSLRQEAEAEESKLSQEGFSTRIYP